MANEIATKTESMEKDINELTTLLSNAEKAMNQMFSEMVALDAMWDGAANEAFNIQFANDYQLSKDMCKTIRDLIGCISFAKTEYVKCEQEVGSIVSSIRI